MVHSPSSHRPLPALAVGLGLAALLAMAPAPARAVTFIEQAQRLERVYAALLDLRPGAPPEVPGDDAPHYELAAELIPVPSIDNQVGAKKEPVNPPPVIPRGRARAALAWNGLFSGGAAGVMGGLTYSPPVEVLGFTATWFGGEGAVLGRFAFVHVALRGYAIAGTVTGPITEKGSDDEYAFANSGADVRVGVPWEHWWAYAGMGSGHLETSLKVVSDGAIIRDDGSYDYLLGGIAYAWDPFLFTFEQQSTEDYLRHILLGAAWKF